MKSCYIRIDKVTVQTCLHIFRVTLMKSEHYFSFCLDFVGYQMCPERGDKSNHRRVNRKYKNMLRRINLTLDSGVD